MDDIEQNNSEQDKQIAAWNNNMLKAIDQAIIDKQEYESWLDEYYRNK